MILDTREDKTYTPAEAAVLSGVPLQVIHKAIDAGPLADARGRRVRRRTLTRADILYLAVSRVFDPKLVQLTERAKSRLRQAIASQRGTAKKRGKLVLFGGLELDLKPVVATIESQATRLERAKKMVTTNPHIRGGEPVIRGTRIGVYEVAAMVEGASGQEIEEILAGYPTLKRQHLDLARLYAAAHPRRGRPRKHPWHRPPAAAPA